MKSRRALTSVGPAAASIQRRQHDDRFPVVDSRRELPTASTCRSSDWVKIVDRRSLTDGNRPSPPHRARALGTAAAAERHAAAAQAEARLAEAWEAQPPPSRRSSRGCRGTRRRMAGGCRVLAVTVRRVGRQFDHSLRGRIGGSRCPRRAFSGLSRAVRERHRGGASGRFLVGTVGVAVVAVVLVLLPWALQRRLIYLPSTGPVVSRRGRAARWPRRHAPYRRRARAGCLAGAAADAGGVRDRVGGQRQCGRSGQVSVGPELVRRRTACGCREPGHLMRPARTRGRGRRAGLVGAAGWPRRNVAGCRLRAGADPVIGEVGAC